MEIADLEESIIQVQKIDRGFYQELLNDYTNKIQELKSNNDSLFWERAIMLEERKADIEARLPNVSDEEFEEYVALLDLLGIIYEEVGQWKQQMSRN